MEVEETRGEDRLGLDVLYMGQGENERYPYLYQVDDKECGLSFWDKVFSSYLKFVKFREKVTILNFLSWMASKSSPPQIVVTKVVESDKKPSNEDIAKVFDDRRKYQNSLSCN